MITDKEIEKLVTIEPFNKQNLGPSSYDLRISGALVKYVIDVKQGEALLKDEIPKVEHIAFERVMFLPPWFTEDEVALYKAIHHDKTVVQTPVLGASEEIVTLPKNICASYTGRSSWGRKFLESHMTAGYVDNGFSGTITFEIIAHIPVEVAAGDRIGQLIFQKTKVPTKHYGEKADAKYQNQILPTPSRAHEDHDCGTTEYIYVDGSVAKNPGDFGIAGMLFRGVANCFTYSGEGITNNMMEVLAIRHALLKIEEQLIVNPKKQFVIISDSLLAINGTTGTYNIRAENLIPLVEKNAELYDKLQENVTIKHVKGHSKDDIIGDTITALSKQYTQTGRLVPNEKSTVIIESSLTEVYA
ncbi:deoxycytidine triphosphate deaminase [Methanococcus maripaludis]|uniref:Deoxycytidine triphosphate deaminase n=1 Tax=Methanococcus maripaludis TaxID=39152 RepID=A0A7J9NWV8_METMI|nr:dCTP deaminase [Methanococcus maripaludis]MBA2851735.1 deoxycytidine triphosphate deaminase [Methanococcus maripaludis]